MFFADEFQNLVGNVGLLLFQLLLQDGQAGLKVWRLQVHVQAPFEPVS